MEGWVKIFRKRTEWEWYRDGNTKDLFLHLLLTANREGKSWRGVRVERGQRLTSRAVLAAETGMSEGQVKRSLEKLIATNNLTTKATNKYTIITVCNFESYQDSTSDSDQQSDQQPDQPADHKQEEKKINIYSQKKELSKESKKEKPSSPRPLSLPYSSTRFVEVWETLRTQPKWKGKTQTALQLSLDKLGKYDEEFAISLMEDAIERNWQGVVFQDTNERYLHWKEGRGKQSSRLDAYLETAIKLGLIHDGTGQSDTVDEQ